MLIYEIGDITNFFEHNFSCKNVVSGIEECKCALQSKNFACLLAEMSSCAQRSGHLEWMGLKLPSSVFFF